MKQTVVLWRAPNRTTLDPASEVASGFLAESYPGDGLYLATNAMIAMEFAKAYENGLQQIEIPADVFEQMKVDGVVLADGYYRPGSSWRVPPEMLAAFNATMLAHGISRYDHPSRGNS